MRELDIALIFPMNDAASARLMIVKAECLHSAGVISAAEKRTILNGGAAIIEESTCPPYAIGSPHRSPSAAPGDDTSMGAVTTRRFPAPRSGRGRRQCLRRIAANIAKLPDAITERQGVLTARVFATASDQIDLRTAWFALTILTKAAVTRL